MKAPLLEFEVIQTSSIDLAPPKPRLTRAQVPKLMYAFGLMVLRGICYDLRWDRLARKISAHKFKLFPALRHWQVDKWVVQLRRQKLFPNASESELRELARDVVANFMI